MIIATAGHIDHGKTSLVRALTGVQTDRLPDERRRGISIDLGFAHWSDPDGRRGSFIDVPGHERYVRNMIAGLQGIDAAMLVIAADDGPMPQTAEHAAILSLLGLRRVIVAVNKIDRIEPADRPQVIHRVRQWLSEGPLDGAQVVPVSAVTGEGLPALRAAIEALQRGHPEPPDDNAPPASKIFRMPIDRVFGLPGEAMVVTGTVLDGSIAIGDKLAIGPRNRMDALRVRGLRVAGETAPAARAGVRLAVSLGGQGAHVALAQRGDWLVEPSLNLPVQAVDAWVECLPGVTLPPRGLTTHLHAGTAHRSARLSPIGGGLWRLHLHQPVLAQVGDRWLLRSADAARTLGVAIVADPFPSSTGLRASERRSLLASLRPLSAIDALHCLARELPEGIDPARFDAAYGRAIADAQRHVGMQRVHWRGASRIIDAARIPDAISRIEAAVAQHHRHHPSLAGPGWSEVCKALAPVERPMIAMLALEQVIAGGRLQRWGVSIRQPGHRPKLEAARRDAWLRIETRIEDERGRARSVHEIAGTLGEPAEAIASILDQAALAGLVYRVSATRFVSLARAADLARIASNLASGDSLTPAAFNAASGIGRNLSIELLEWFDSIRFTRRTGTRRLVLDPPDRFFPVAAASAAPPVACDQDAGGNTLAETAVAGTAKSPPPR